MTYIEYAEAQAKLRKLFARGIITQKERVDMGKELIGRYKKSK